MSSVLTTGLHQSVGHLTAEGEVTRLRARSPFMVSERENTRASGCSGVTSLVFLNWRACPQARRTPVQFLGLKPIFWVLKYSREMSVSLCLANGYTFAWLR